MEPLVLRTDPQSGAESRDKTIPQIFNARVAATPDSIGYAHFDRNTGRWVDTTWAQMRDMVEAWKRAFAASRASPGDRVALLLDNGVYWVCFDQAALSLGLVTVPLYGTDSPDNWAHVLQDSAPVLLLVGKLDPWHRLEALRGQFPSVRTVVCADPEAVTEGGISSLSDWLSSGVEPPDVRVTPDTLATITYSSGTTGRPKGIMLSHRNLTHATACAFALTPGRATDVFLSYLPLAHVFARTVEYYSAMLCGGRMVFARSVAELAEDFNIVQPTILMGVPRIFERVWQRIEGASKSSMIANWLFRAAVRLHPIRHRSIAHRIASDVATRLVSKPVLAKFGGRVRLVVSGSAPLSKELAHGLRAVGLPVVEGYGLAEAAGPVSGDEISDYQPGTVGPPLEGVEARLSDRGELLVRSPSVMVGYWGRDDETAQAIDRDGWLHTGDLAEWVDGRIRIVGRVHDIIVAATGEKLAPSDVESRITHDPLFNQAVVIGNHRQFVAAIVVLEPSAWDELARSSDLDPSNPGSREAEKLLLKRVAALTTDMPKCAQVRRLHATLEPWTADNGLATATLKLRRAKIEEYYRDQIEAFYAERSARQRIAERASAPAKREASHA